MASILNRPRVLAMGMTVLGTSLHATEWSPSAVLEIETANQTQQSDSQKLEAILEPQLEGRFNNSLRLTAIGRLRFDSKDQLEPGKPDQDSIGSASERYFFNGDGEAELREFYIETGIGSAYLTLGKQQVVWGKADGLKILDVVNPQSFREFILDDFEDSRIPLWTLNLEMPLGSDTLQLLWVPDQTYHELPTSNATYSFTSPQLVPIAPSDVSINLRPVTKPSQLIKDSDLGLRWSSFRNGWDLTLNYLYHYHDLPVLFQNIQLTPQGPIVSIEPEYKRSHLFGGTFSKAFGDLTLRGEIGYSTDRYYLSNNPAETDGVSQAEELASVLGFDWFGISDTFLSLQVFQSTLINPPTNLSRSDTDTTFTFLARREFFNDTLEAEILWLANSNDGDGLARPKITYEWQDDVKSWIGADILYGDKNELFGQFENNDRVVVGLEIGF